MRLKQHNDPQNSLVCSEAVFPDVRDLLCKSRCAGDATQALSAVPDGPHDRNGLSRRGHDVDRRWRLFWHRNQPGRINKSCEACNASHDCRLPGSNSVAFALRQTARSIS
jgi:hypothetical protein